MIELICFRLRVPILFEERQRKSFCVFVSSKNFLEHFKKQWCHSLKPVVWHHAWLRNVPPLSSEEFDGFVRPFSDAEQTSKLMKKVFAGSAAGEKYDPSENHGLCIEGGTTYFNTYVPSEVRDYDVAELNALRKREPDYAAPFQRFLDQLVPDELDRRHVSRWAATLLAVRGVKMGYGVLLFSETQCVGKTTLGETICGKVLGAHNAVSISASVMIDSNYQYWAEKQLIVINEIHEDHRVKVYNKLKSTITDGVIDVNKKWYAPYKTKNFVNVFACSNDPRALSLPNDDRRWLIVEVTDVIQSNKFWDELRDWLENQDGYRRVRQWAKLWREREVNHAAAGLGDRHQSSQLSHRAVKRSNQSGGRDRESSPTRRDEAQDSEVGQGRRPHRHARQRPGRGRHRVWQRQGSSSGRQQTAPHHSRAGQGHGPVRRRGAHHLARLGQRFPHPGRHHLLAAGQAEPAGAGASAGQGGRQLPAL